MDLVLVNIIDGLVTGLLLFMLSSGLTLIFSMMGVLNFAHASFYMLGAYFGYTISTAIGFWPALLIAPPLVGVCGALVERYGLRRVHQYGHVPELIFTFGLALLIEEVVQFFWGQDNVPFAKPEVLTGPAFSIAGQDIQAYSLFMIFLSMAIFAGLLGLGLAAVLVWAGWTEFARNWASGAHYGGELNVPKWPSRALFTLAAGFFALAALQVLWEDLRGRSVPSGQEG